MKFVPKTVSRSIGMKMLTLKKNRPHITFGAGVAGVLVGNYLTARATLKLSDLLDEFKTEVEDVKTHRDEDDPQRGRDLTYVYAKNTLKLAKLYGPAAVVTGVSIASLVGSHVELNNRNKALTVTLLGVTKAYDEYRARVREEIGEDRERDIYYNVQEQEFENEDGTKTKALSPTGDPTHISPYAKFFDEYSRYWQKDPEMNRLFVQVAQNHANQLLQTQGYLFLNDVYDSLGIPRTRAGQVVGWLLEGEGDGYIDFGMYSNNDNGFVNGWNRSVLLDFNVDGPILDMI